MNKSYGYNKFAIGFKDGQEEAAFHSCLNTVERILRDKVEIIEDEQGNKTMRFAVRFADMGE